MISLNSSFGQFINPSVSAGPLPIIAPQTFNNTPSHQLWLSTFNSSSSSLFADLDILKTDTVPFGLKDNRHIILSSRRSSRLKMKSKPEARVSRRSLNAYSHKTPRVVRLIGRSVARQGGGGGQERTAPVGNVALEVAPSGAVRATVNLSSIYSVLQVLCLCCIAPRSFRPCPLPNEDTRDQDGHSIFASVLLHYNETNRYLCINSRGKVYSRLKSDDPSTLRDCVFIHTMTLSNGYDVFKSKSYPKLKPRCHHNNLSKSLYCRSSWYLAVNKEGHVRVAKSDSIKPPLRTFFQTKWIHDDLSPHWKPQELSVMDLQKESSSQTLNKPKKNKIFQILPSKSVLPGSFGRARKLKSEKKSSGKDCNNLLSSQCGSYSLSREGNSLKKEGSGRNQQKSKSLKNLFSLKDPLRSSFLISRTEDQLRHGVLT